MKDYRIRYSIDSNNELNEILSLISSSTQRWPDEIDFRMTEEEFTLFWLASCDIRATGKIIVFEMIWYNTGVIKRKLVK